jgi:hypothetical protein
LPFLPLHFHHYLLQMPHVCHRPPSQLSLCIPAFKSSQPKGTRAPSPTLAHKHSASLYLPLFLSILLSLFLYLNMFLCLSLLLFGFSSHTCSCWIWTLQATKAATARYAVRPHV